MQVLSTKWNMKIKHILYYFTLIYIFDRCKGQNGTTLKFPLNGKVTISELTKNNGYSMEAHNVVTEDGYMLTMHRIGNCDNEITKIGENKPVVLLMHGLLGSADNWITGGHKKALAYLLSDKGYDVWLGNCRGTRYSRKHKKLKPNFDGNYWDFSWHEIGVYDLPASIDYILYTTNQTQIFYIGHSQGTTISYVLLSEKPEYNSKIKLLLSLAPVAYVSNIRHPLLRGISRYHFIVEQFMNALNLKEIIPNNELIILAGRIICEERIVLQEICANIFFLIAGYDSQQLDRSDLPTIMSTVPAGASTRQFLHYAQEIDSGFFRQYDFGRNKNFKVYGSGRPPKYNIKNITVPVALFYAQNDWLTSVKDVERLSLKLPNVVLKYLVPFKYFNHVDFLWAIDVEKLLYTRMLNIMEKYL